MEPPSTPPDRKKQRAAPETPPKDKRCSEIVVSHNSHKLRIVDFFGKGSASQDLNPGSGVAKAERGRAGNRDGAVGMARVAGRFNWRELW